MVWLMLAEFTCTITYMDSESLEYQVMAEDVIYEVRAYEMMEGRGNSGNTRRTQA